MLPDYMEFQSVRAPDLRLAFKTAPPDALDLLRKLLAFDPNRRLTAEGALAHKYFTTSPLATAFPDLPRPTHRFGDEGGGATAGKASRPPRVATTTSDVRRAPPRLVSGEAVEPWTRTGGVSALKPRPGGGGEPLYARQVARLAEHGAERRERGQPPARAASRLGRDEHGRRLRARHHGRRVFRVWQRWAGPTRPIQRGCGVPKETETGAG